jgi:hypothetical protein
MGPPSYTVTLVQVGGILRKLGVWSSQSDVCKVMAEVPNQHRLHPTFISYVNKGVYQIAMPLMGIWVHPYYTFVQVGVEF